MGGEEFAVNARPWHDAWAIGIRRLQQAPKCKAAWADIARAKFPIVRPE